MDVKENGIDITLVVVGGLGLPIPSSLNQKATLASLGVNVLIKQQSDRAREGDIRRCPCDSRYCASFKGLRGKEYRYIGRGEES